MKSMVSIHGLRVEGRIDSGNGAVTGVCHKVAAKKHDGLPAAVKPRRRRRRRTKKKKMIVILLHVFLACGTFSK